MARALERISGHLGSWGAVCVFLLMANVIVDVALRFVDGRSLPSTIDTVSYWWMVPMIMFGTVAAEGKSEHIRVGFLSGSIGPQFRAIAAIMNATASAGFAALLTWASALQAFERVAQRETTVMQIPIWPVRLLVPASLLILTLAFVYRAMAALRGEGFADTATKI